MLNSSAHNYANVMVFITSLVCVAAPAHTGTIHSVVLDASALSIVCTVRKYLFDKFIMHKSFHPILFRFSSNENDDNNKSLSSGQVPALN